MSLDGLFLSLLPGGRGVVAFVGAGGKSSALFAVARGARARGLSVLVTTTTRMTWPGDGEPGDVDGVVFLPELESAAVEGESRTSLLPRGPGAAILFSREGGGPGKVRGIHPSWIDLLRPGWDLVLVEADGSRRLPLKAPGPHEPVLPPGTDLVVGVLGLDGLGRPMDGATVHRPEIFSAVAGCPAGSPVEWAHLVALVRHPEGLFKGAPGARALVLNKLDRAPFVPTAAQVASLGVEANFVGSVRERTR